MPKQTTATISTTTTDTRTHTARRKGGGSEALQAVRSQQAEWARVWHSLPASAKNGFQRLAAQTTPPRANGKPRLSAFFFFSQMNTAIVNAGGEPILVPPSVPQPAQTLPKQVTLGCSVSGSALTIAIGCSAYAHKVVIYGAAPTMADTTLRDSDFVKIGFVTALPAPGIGIMYQNAFGLPQEGEKIALKLMGVSASGYTTEKQAVSGFVEATLAAEGENTDSTDAPLKLRAVKGKPPAPIMGEQNYFLLPHYWGGGASLLPSPVLTGEGRHSEGGVRAFYSKRRDAAYAATSCLSFSAWSADTRASITGWISPPSRRGRLCRVRPMRWSVMRSCGKLYVRIFSSRPPVPTMLLRDDPNASSCLRCSISSRRDFRTRAGPFRSSATGNADPDRSQSCPSAGA